MHKLRKLAGIVSAVKKLSAVLLQGAVRKYKTRKKCPATAPPPIVSSNALSRNAPHGSAGYDQALCNGHARRKCLDVSVHFPDPFGWVGAGTVGVDPGARASLP